MFGGDRFLIDGTGIFEPRLNCIWRSMWHARPCVALLDVGLLWRPADSSRRAWALSVIAYRGMGRRSSCARALRVRGAELTGVGASRHRHDTVGPAKLWRWPCGMSVKTARALCAPPIHLVFGCAVALQCALVRRRCCPKCIVTGAVAFERRPTSR